MPDDPRFTDPFDDDFEVRTFDTATMRPVGATPGGEARTPAPARKRSTEGPSRRLPIGADARPRRRSHPAKPTETRVWLSTLGAVLTVSAAAVLVATIFSLWTRPAFFSEEFQAGLNKVQATQHLVNIMPTPIPTDTRQVKIGIIAGHSGPPQDENFQIDPGAVCPDGLTELELNTAVAQLVVADLLQENYSVELLEEFDPKLDGYQATALISIHTNDCGDYGYAGTGYNIVSATGRASTRGEDDRLLECLITQYGQTTGLPRHYGVTDDMTFYHTFSEISADTPTAIIEIGYMRNDRAVLTQQPDRIALGIANGIRCFLREPGYDSFGTGTTIGAQAGQ